MLARGQCESVVVYRIGTYVGLRETPQSIRVLVSLLCFVQQISRTVSFGDGNTQPRRKHILKCCFSPASFLAAPRTVQSRSGTWTRAPWYENRNWREFSHGNARMLLGVRRRGLLRVQVWEGSRLFLCTSMTQRMMRSRVFW